MDIDKDFLTLLTPDGEFLRAHNHQKHFQIGQEIDFFPIVQEEKVGLLTTLLQSLKGKKFFAAALLCIFLFATIFPFMDDDKVYAYMSIDVNPSIELGVNEKFQVIEITPYNEEGKQVIANLQKWKKKNIHELTSEIIQEMKAKGYIKNHHEVLLTTVSEQENMLENNERWKKEIAEIKTIVTKEQLDLKVIEGSKEERKKAIENGITTGVYKESQKLKVNKSTSKNKEKSKPKETSEIRNNKEETISKGQTKKAESMEQSKQKLEERKNNHWNKENEIPPGQIKKQENNKKQSWKQQQSSKEKQNDKGEKFENNQKNKDKYNKNKDEKNNHQKNREQKYKDRNNNEHRQHKENNGNRDKDE